MAFSIHSFMRDVDTYRFLIATHLSHFIFERHSHSPVFFSRVRQRSLQDNLSIDEIEMEKIGTPIDTGKFELAVCHLACTLYFFSQILNFFAISTPHLLPPILFGFSFNAFNIASIPFIVEIV